MQALPRVYKTLLKRLIVSGRRRDLAAKILRRVFHGFMITLADRHATSLGSPKAHRLPIPPLRRPQSRPKSGTEVSGNAHTP
jgi:hypothetical protein